MLIRRGLAPAGKVFTASTAVSPQCTGCFCTVRQNGILLNGLLAFALCITVRPPYHYVRPPISRQNGDVIFCSQMMRLCIHRPIAPPPSPFTAWSMAARWAGVNTHTIPTAS